ncbi:hypothetical protein LDENG_00111090 [Lucifuga dentata]|nr:hypothetical protein LDENG_00111090 [Lucifuga dentata]
MEPDQQLRNLRDFLLVYNRMTEICFQRCTSNFNYRNLTMDEERCVDSCAGKLIRSNHCLMGTYVQLMPRMMQQRLEEMESKAAENAKAAEAAASAASTEGSAAAQTPVTPSPPQEFPPVLPPTVTDAGAVQPPAVPAEAASSSLSGLGEAVVRPEALKPTGLDVPVNLDAAAPKAAVPTEIKLSAAAPTTPAAETLNLLEVRKVDSRPSYTADFPQLTKAGVQIQSELVPAPPVLTPPKAASLSADVPLSGLGSEAPPKASESLSGPEKVPEVSPLSGQK